VQLPRRRDLGRVDDRFLQLNDVGQTLRRRRVCDRVRMRERDVACFKCVTGLRETLERAPEVHRSLCGRLRHTTAASEPRSRRDRTILGVRLRPFEAPHQLYELRLLRVDLATEAHDPVSEIGVRKGEHTFDGTDEPARYNRKCLSGIGLDETARR
jgi:hypothetical protein